MILVFCSGFTHRFTAARDRNIVNPASPEILDLHLITCDGVNQVKDTFIVVLDVLVFRRKCRGT